MLKAFAWKITPRFLALIAPPFLFIYLSKLIRAIGLINKYEN